MFLHLLKFSARPLLGSSKRTTALAALAWLTLASGCSRYTQTKQCRALIAQVNPALDEVLTMTHGRSAGGASNAGGAASAGGGSGGSGGSGAGVGGPSSAGYVAAAGRYERLAKQLGPMEFGSEDMAKYVAEYAGILNSAAENLRLIAAALDTGNAAEADRINRELERIAGHERSVVARMDAWCQP